jgi:hypothetical protein
MKENIRVPLCWGIVRAYSPLALVVVPTVVPFNNTVTPGKASPFSSVTLPEISSTMAA